MECLTFPEDNKTDSKAYLAAIKAFSPGDIAVVTTPDDTHFEIVMAAINRGLHVMCTKPLVKTLKEQREVAEAAKKNGVIVCVEYHKRYDPIYNDAVNRIRTLGDFGCALFSNTPLLFNHTQKNTQRTNKQTHTDFFNLTCRNPSSSSRLLKLGQVMKK